ncbi:hypothetical protein [Epilithonimonas caeni]|uniref:hypothetical protein n=1 Tax=Epilithonimonas caeni TaxID=365343 RepID=UPI00041A3E86|nr:hypothetical protein [Epilithonimonas caeni]
MKKILLISIFALSIFYIKAQNINFTNLYGNNASEPENYHISNTNVGFGGDWGLDVKWWGGVKLKSSLGVFYINKWGNVGINTENPSATLDINGTLKTTGDINTRDIISDGSNSWIFHTPDNGSTQLYIAPRLANGLFDWAKQTVFNNNGNVAVSGKLEATEVKVTQGPTADFVFEEDYGLPTLEEVEKHIKEKKHLPEIASAKEMEKEGVNVGEFQIKLLQKIEELTLYSIEQNKQIKELKSENQILKEQTQQITFQSEKIKSLESENHQFKSLLNRIERLEKLEKQKN